MSLVSDPRSLGPGEFAELLSQERWLVPLVRRLVHPADVDDVLQDTWLAAIRRPPQDQAAWSRWLSTVARNFARARWQSRRRRQEGERQAAKPEALPPTQETIDRLATVELLLATLRDLPEPYRSAVLLRHYHGLDFAAIAQRTQVSEASVRQRVKRGLDELRRRLVDRYGPAWRDRLQVILLPLALPRAAAASLLPATAIGLFMMNSKLILGAAGLLTCGVILVTVMQSTEAPLATELESAVQAAEVDPAGEDLQAVDRSAVESRTSIEEDSSPIMQAGRLLDRRGQPLPAVRMMDVAEEVLAESDTQGAFTYPRLPDSQFPQPDERWFVLRKPHDGDEGAAADELLYLLSPRVKVSGRIVDSEGQPLSGVKIRASLPALVDFPASLDATWGVTLPKAESEEDGSFAFDALPGEAGRLRFSTPGYLAQVHELLAFDEHGLEIRMEALSIDHWTLTGQVLDQGDWPLAHATVGFGDLKVKSDQYGNYAIELTKEEVDAQGESLYAAMVGYQTLVLPAPGGSEFGADRALDMDLRIPGPALSISGWVIAPNGEPAVEAVVALWEENRMPGAGFAENLSVSEEIKDHVYGLAPRRVYAVTADDGSFEIDGLRDKEYRLRVIHEDHLTMTSVPLAAGASGVELQYPENNFRRVLCRIVNRDGEPMPDLRVDMSTYSSRTKGSSQLDMWDDLRSDEHGEVFLPRVLNSEAVQVRVRGPAIVVAFHFIEPDVRESCEIVVDRRCHFRVETSDAAWANAECKLADGMGKRVFISTTPNTMNEVMRLVDGKSTVVSAPESAVTLLLTGEGGKKEVLLGLVPGEVTVLRF